MFGLVLRTRRGKLNLHDTNALWRRFGHYVRPHAAALSVALLASSAVVAAQLLSPWPIKVVFDQILHIGGKPTQDWLARLTERFAGDPSWLLFWVCAAIVLIAVLDAIFSYIRDIALGEVGQRVVGKLRQDLFGHLQTLSPAELERHHTGSLLTRLSGDIIMLRQLLVGGLVGITQSVLTVAALAVAMVLLNWKLALIGFATVPLSLLASWRISKRIRKATEKQREKESEVASLAQDVLGAMSVIQAFNREPIEQKRFVRTNRSTTRAGLRTTRLEARLYRIITLTSAVGMCAILFVGVRSVLAGVMTAGDLLVFVAYLRAVSRPLRDVAKITGQWAKATACGKRIAELFDVQPSVRDRKGALPLPDCRGAVEFDDVTFAYEPSRPAIDRVSLRIEPGERIAVVGATGAGKSTLMKLLLRFYDPQLGSVRLDGCDIREIRVESLRRQIGWVSQHTILFGMSVIDNLTLGRPDADEAEIRAAALRVRAHEFIDRLPDGYHTVLGQDGATLSGGQRQRLALGRALLRRPRILLLDEPVTGLDALTQQVVEGAWMAADNTATTVLICHHLTSMERFDRIVVMGDGRIRGVGPHSELLDSCVEYAALLSAASGDARVLVEAPA